MSTTLDRPRHLASDPLEAIGSWVAEKLAVLGGPSMRDPLIDALHELLDGQDEAARQLHTAIQIHLVKVSKERSDSEAARIMGCSRPYVAMLIDAKKNWKAVWCQAAATVKFQSIHHEMDGSKQSKFQEQEGLQKGCRRYWNVFGSGEGLHHRKSENTATCRLTNTVFDRN